MRSLLGARGARPSATTRGAPRLVTVTARTDPGPEALRAWDRLVDRTPGTDVTQLSAWARLRAMVGFDALYVLAQCDGTIVGGAQILTRRIPVLGTIGYLPYGPLVAPDAVPRAEVEGVLTGALRTLCRRRLRMLFVQPPEGAERISAELRERGFRPSSAGIAPAGSIRIDLTEDLATIRSRFGRRLRSWPNRWAARGVTVRRGDERDIPLLAEFMRTSAQHQGYTPLPTDYVTALYRDLAATGHAALFVGEVHGSPVAVDLVTGCGDMLRGRLSGFGRDEEAARLSVPAAIRWEILQWGKAAGYHWLDFGGLRPQTLDALLSENPAEHDWPSADQPKVTFGGTAFRYPPAVEMIRPAPLRMAYDLAERSPAGRRVFARAKSLLRGARQRSGTPTAQTSTEAPT